MNIYDGEKTDKGFEIFYWNLSYRRRLIRLLWTTPIVLFIVFYSFDNLEMSFKDLSVILFLTLMYVFQFLYNFLKWKNIFRRNYSMNVNKVLVKLNNKLEIAKELLANTKSLNLNNFKEIQNKNNKELETLGLFEYIDFDKCLEYIVISNFNIKEWCLLEIPLSNIYTFYNANRKNYFDLIVYNDNVNPQYLDENSNTSDANSIQEAIEKYIN